MTQSEGYTKYSAEHIESVLEKDLYFEEINELRNLLYKEHMIGQLPNGIGFGNISWRFKADTFYISGSGTGKKEILSFEDYALVTYTDIEGNFLKFQGLVGASSESLTHAVIYKKNQEVKCVAHIHHEKYFDFLLKTDYSYTKPEVEFGTTALALAIGTEAEKSSNNLVYSLGHVPGIFFWSTSAENLKELIFNIYKELVCHTK